jgi:hypothetical protein
MALTEISIYVYIYTGKRNSTSRSAPCAPHEQGRKEPEAAARAYLMVIGREPEAVGRAFLAVG